MYSLLNKEDNIELRNNPVGCVVTIAMNPKSKRIHLIETDYRNYLCRLNPDSQVWESGFWSLPEDKAQKLIGGSILFHRSKITPSFCGGLILDCRTRERGEWKGQVIFKFEYLDNQRHVWTDGKGWRQDMKIVLNG